MCAQNAPGNGTSLEQRKAQQHRVPHDAPDRVDGIPGYGNILKQNRVDRHADQDQKALKTQRKQGFQIVLPDVARSWLPQVAIGTGARLTII